MERDEQLERVIRGATLILMDSILNMLQKDPHQWSTRPCPTCDTISNLIGKPFGCAKYRIDNKR